MKKQFTLLKIALIGLFLISNATAFSQALISADNQDAIRPPLSGTDASTIFVYGGTGFTLTASLTSTGDGGQADITFTNFDWAFRNAANGADNVGSLTFATAIPQGTANSQLNVTGLAPGFYTFIAHGFTENEICSAPEQEFTVFVLAPLVVTVSATGELTYCADDIGSAERELTATASYDATVWNTQTNLTSENPALSDFELRYRWYKVADDETFDIGTATLVTTQTPTTNTTTDTYTLIAANDVNIGDWNYYVAVDYTVKASGPYINALGGIADPTIIKVTPKPGKPTISIAPNP